MKNNDAYQGRIFFSGAFRPFFLGAAIWSILVIGLWLLILAGELDLANEMGSSFWHRHEMIFGFAGAALAGFILTAMPNWTGRPALKGNPLIGLVFFWLIGRFGMLGAAFWGPSWLSLLDIPFLFVLFFVVWRDITLTNNKRNYPVVYLFAAFASANVITIFQGLGAPGIDGFGWRLGLGTIIILLTFIGGRIIPNFTRNWLRQNRSTDGPLPKPPSKLDAMVLLFNICALLLWTVIPHHLVSGIALLAAGLMQFIRLSRWCGFKTLRASIVFVLHVGYAWIGCGLALLGSSILWGGLASSAALHALTIGGVGTMTLAVMSRASLGHSGKEITAGFALSATYILISLATLARLASGLWFEHYTVLLNISGSLWILAFAIFAALFAPLYFKPRH